MVKESNRTALANAMRSIAAMKSEWDIGKPSKRAWKEIVVSPKYAIIHMNYDHCYYEGDIPSIEIKIFDSLKEARRWEERLLHVNTLLIDQNFKEYDLYD